MLSAGERWSARENKYALPLLPVTSINRNFKFKAHFQGWLRRFSIVILRKFGCLSLPFQMMQNKIIFTNSFFVLGYYSQKNWSDCLWNCKMTGVGILTGHPCTQRCWRRRQGKFNSSHTCKGLSLSRFSPDNKSHIHKPHSYTTIHQRLFLFPYTLLSLALAATISTNNLASEFNSGWIRSIYPTLCWKKSALRTTAYENLIIISMDNYNKLLVWNTRRIGTEVKHSNLPPSSTHRTPSAALLFYPWPLRMFSGSVTASWLRSWEVSKMHFLEMGKSNWFSQPTKTKQKE